MDAPRWCHDPAMAESLIPKHGGCRDLKSFQNAAIV
jgi:hypothetical protein